MANTSKQTAILLPSLLVLVLAVMLTGCHDKTPAASTSSVVLGHPPTPEYIVTNPPIELKAASISSLDKHASKGVTCEQCHGEAVPTSAPTSNRACLGCHKRDALVKATVKYDDVQHKSQNPHDSHMHGASCLVCHKNHGESVLACDKCHLPKFGWKVP